MAYSTVGRQSPQPQVTSSSNAQLESKPTLALPSAPRNPIQNTCSFDFRSPIPVTRRRLDLDGMVLTDLDPTANSNTDMNLGLPTVEEASDEMNVLDHTDSPTTAAFAPFIKEIFGPGWRCPSPVVLHIGDPAVASPLPICPIWKKSNELFGKVFSYGPNTASPLNIRLDSVEAGFLFLGIKDGWSSFDGWQESPALKILKSIDEFLFVHLPKMERLAVAYKSYKLLKVSTLLNSTVVQNRKETSCSQPTVLSQRHQYRARESP
jgi:hypothetical protein